MAVLLVQTVVGALRATAVREQHGPAWLAAAGVGVPVLVAVLAVQRARR